MNWLVELDWKESYALLLKMSFQHDDGAWYFFQSVLRLKITVFWDVPPCSSVGRYQCFCKSILPFSCLPWRWRQQVLLKHWYLSTKVHSVATQKTAGCTYNTTSSSSVHACSADNEKGQVLATNTSEDIPVLFSVLLNRLCAFIVVNICLWGLVW
jgi:hypothetical protein